MHPTICLTSCLLRDFLRQGTARSGDRPQSFALGGEPCEALFVSRKVQDGRRSDLRAIRPRRPYSCWVTFLDRLCVHAKAACRKFTSGIAVGFVFLKESRCINPNGSTCKYVSSRFSDIAYRKFAITSAKPARRRQTLQNLQPMASLNHSYCTLAKSEVVSNHCLAISGRSWSPILLPG